jgi:hypothetical protein
MSYISKATAKADSDSVDAYKGGSDGQPSSPAHMGGSSPGPSNALAGATMTLRKKRGADDMGSAAHKGGSVTRKLE